MEPGNGGRREWSLGTEGGGSGWSLGTEGGSGWSLGTEGGSGAWELREWVEPGN